MAGPGLRRIQVTFPDGHVEAHGRVWPDEGERCSEVLVEVESGVLIDADGAVELEPGRYRVSDEGWECLSDAS